MKLIIPATISIICMVSMFGCQSNPSKSAAASIPLAQHSESPLAQKLVECSPWNFTTQYEDTNHEFMFDENGVLRRKSPRTKGEWVQETITTKQTILYPTRSGHTITFALDSKGSVTADHSKHISRFKSLKAGCS